MKRKYKIYDWAGNECFNGVTFNSFEEGWGFLYETFPNGDDDGTFNEYFVLHDSRYVPSSRSKK